LNTPKNWLNSRRKWKKKKGNSEIDFPIHLESGGRKNLKISPKFEFADSKSQQAQILEKNTINKLVSR
jgi:hypothetical protein